MTRVTYSEIDSLTYDSIKVSLRRLDELSLNSSLRTAFGQLYPDDYYITAYIPDNGTSISLHLDTALNVYSYYSGDLSTRTQREENIIDELEFDFWWRPERYSPECQLCHKKSKRTNELLTSEVNTSRDLYSNGWYPPIIEAIGHSSSQYHEDCLLQLITDPMFELLEQTEEQILAIQI